MLSFLSLPLGRVRALLDASIPVLFAATMAALLIKHFTLDSVDPYKCMAVLDRGRWSHDFETRPPHLQWHPDGCMLRQYTPEEASACLSDLTVIGDSTARQFFCALADKLKSRGKVSTGSFELSPLIAKHADMTLAVGTREMHFIWDPYLNGTNIFQIPLSSPRGPILVISGGLWHTHYLDIHYQDTFEEHLTRLFTEVRLQEDNVSRSPSPRGMDRRRPIFLPITPPAQANLNPDRSATLTLERTSLLNARLRRVAEEYNFNTMWATLPMTNGHDTAFEANGIHVSDLIALQQVDILLNLLCNEMTTVTPGRYCCSGRGQINPAQGFLLVVASVLLFYWMQQTARQAIWASCTPLGKPARALAVVAGTSLYTYLADRTTIMERVNKLTDERLFLAFCFVALLLGIATLSRNLPATSESEKDDEVEFELLSRQQTEEWKGWMQVFILLYHYFGMSRVMWVYRIVRVLVGSYLFLTGYGHTRYFVTTNDFSSRRAIAVLLRLNLLACMLSSVMGTKYDFYYFPALSSLWFLVTWLTIPRKLQGHIDLGRVVIRMSVSLAAMEMLLHVKGIQTELFSALTNLGMLSIDQQEWAFRVKLDRYVPYLGMLTAVLQHKKRQHHSFAATPWLRERRIGKEALLVLSLLLSIAYFTFTFRCSSKEVFNASHPFTAPVPILTYVALRNVTSTLRSRHSRFFAWFGRHSLETFILQYHIWLAADTKGLLRLGILDGCLWYGETTVSSTGFWVEVAIITAFFVWACSAVSSATSVVTNWIISSRSTDPAWTSQSRADRPSGYDWLFCCRQLQLIAAKELGMRVKVLALLLLLWLVNVSS